MKPESTCSEGGGKARAGVCVQGAGCASPSNSWRERVRKREAKAALRAGREGSRAIRNESERRRRKERGDGGGGGKRKRRGRGNGRSNGRWMEEDGRETLRERSREEGDVKGRDEERGR
eukprot:3935477-Pleurochrysis_carterae.AAC.1